MDWKTAFRAGVSGIRQQPALTIGLYALGLVFSLMLVLPLGLALERATAHAVVPLDLRELTLGQWWALLRAIAAEVTLTQLLLFLLVPLHGLIRSIALTGVAAALRPGDLQGFWTGVGRYGSRGLLVALAFLTLALVWLVGLVFASGLLALIFPGEVALVWTQLVLVPLLFVAGLAALDLAQDYARASVVLEDAAPLEAVGVGLRFPRRHRSALVLYLVWFALAAGLWLLPFVFDVVLRTSVLGLLIVQQLALFARTAATVGWIGSSVRFYADALDRDRLWLAADAPPETPGVATA